MFCHSLKEDGNFFDTFDLNKCAFLYGDLSQPK